jgi:O-antigen/teichoic acid export membrane protein
MNLIPNVAVPLIVLDRLGAKNAGYYFVAFQMAALLYAAVYAVEQSFLSEGSQPGADWRMIRRRSLNLAAVLFVPGCIILVVAARWILLLFGGGYSAHATASLELLALAVMPLAACNWSWTVLRLTGRLRALVFATGTYAVAICTLAWVLAPHGLAAVSAAWPVGTAIAALVAALVTATPSREATSNHRHHTRVGSS